MLVGEEHNNEVSPGLFNVDEYKHFAAIFKVVQEVAADNIEYFVVNEERSHTKFVQSFQSILNILSPFQISLDVITGCCAKFDLDSTCKGNGYRSIINIVESCLNQIIYISEQIQRNRDKLFFRSYQMYAELDAYAQVLARLLTIIKFAIVLLDNSEGRCLFMNDTQKDSIIEDMMDDFNKINRECFYGRSFGFQYDHTVRQSLQIIGVAMAAYGDGYIRHSDTLSRAVSSVIHSGKYLIDPELRAKRITELTGDVDIKFCKAFWSLTEEHGAQHAPLLVCPAMDVNIEFTIPSDDIGIKTLDGTNMDIKLSLCDERMEGVKARLLSFVWRDGQIHNVWKNSKSYGPLGPNPRQRSRYLMIHCHGGGFVAQSSKSHEIYLRYWAKELRIPILSVDYSLAPDAVFPQALDEIFFAYVWALNNLKKLGTTGHKIVFTGDSAGANLATAVILKAIMYNIRLPDGLVVAYPPYRIQYYPSPSRILCLMDPLLPLGILKSCIQAYAGDLKMEKNISKKVDLSKLTSNLYNPFELDFGNDHWHVSHSHNCGQFHSLSETNLDMIKSELGPIHACCEDDEYFSDCPLSDFDSTLETDTDQMRCSSSYGNVLKIVSGEDVIVKKSCLETCEENVDVERSLGSNYSLFQSLKSKVSSEVFDLTSRVSSKVFDDVKSGFTNYLYEKCGLPNPEDVPMEHKQLHGINESEGFCSKRSLDQITSTEVKPTFSICRECLYPFVNCNCNTEWAGRVLATHKRLLDHYGSRHSISGRHLIGSTCSAKCLEVEKESVERVESGNKVFENTCEVAMRNVNTSADDFISTKPSIPCIKIDTSAETPSTDIADFRNPLMSPIFASNELLKKMPPVTILACSLDPLFDDSVEFIRKLQNLDKKAVLKVFDRLPHGFLNLQAFSTEARDACDIMIGCIKKSLNMGASRKDSTQVFAYNAN